MALRGELIALSAIALFFFAFALISLTGEHDWSGADGKAEAVVDEMTGGSYRPWLSPIWTPSGELESLFFSLQAAIGGLIIGYFLGYYSRRNKAS
jgi:cobalt/nickel transport protein